MKTFLHFLEEYDGHNPDEVYTDPAEWLPAYHADWCRENPGHPDCAEHTAKLQKLQAANTADLKELPGAAGKAAHTRLHAVIGDILKSSK